MKLLKCWVSFFCCLYKIYFSLVFIFLSGIIGAVDPYKHKLNQMVNRREDKTSNGAADEKGVVVLGGGGGGKYY